MFTFPPGRHSRTPADIWPGIWLTLHPTPLCATCTQTKILRKLHSHNVAMQEMVAWCKQVDRTSTPTQNPPALSGLSGSSEQYQTQAHSPSFSVFFLSTEMKHFISSLSLIQVDLWLTLDCSLYGLISAAASPHWFCITSESSGLWWIFGSLIGIVTSTSKSFPSLYLKEG